MYEVELSRKAAKFYRKADTATARRLNAAFDRLWRKIPCGITVSSRLAGIFKAVIVCGSVTSESSIPLMMLSELSILR